MHIYRVVFLVLIASVCHGQGFFYDAFDARALGMCSSPFAGGAGPGAIVLNPASAGQRQGLFMTVGSALTMRDADFTGTTTASGNPVPQSFSFSTDNPVGALPQVAFTYAPARLPIGFGLSVSQPFSMSTVWPLMWPGTSNVVRYDEHAVFTTMALGYRVNRMLAVGAAVHVVSGGFSSFSNSANASEGFFQGTADASGTSAAMSASVIVTPAPQFSLALGYLTGTNIALKGTIQETQSASGTSAVTQSETVVHSTMPLPTVLSFGIDIHPTNALRIDAGVEFTGWAGFNGLPLVLADTTMRGATIGPVMKNTTTLRAGAEFFLAKTFALRIGVGYSSPSLKTDSSAQFFLDNGAFLYSAGLGYQFTKNIRFDFGWRGAAVANLNGTAASGYNGTYAISNNVIAASIALAFEPTANPLRSPSSK